MSVKVSVNSEVWSDRGKIPQIRDGVHTSLEKKIQKIVNVPGATKENTAVDLRTLMRTFSNAYQVECMVVKNLTITVEGGAFGEEPATIYEHKGVLAISPTFGGGYSSYWGGRTGTFGHGPSKVEKSRAKSAQASASAFASAWDRMSDEEMFGHFYYH